METKKNLNTIQRKMLDAIYTEQFDKQEKALLDERQLGLAKLKDKLLKQQNQDKKYKKMIEAGQLFHKMSQDLEKELELKGLAVSKTLYGAPKLEFKSSWRTDYDLPEVETHETETTRLEMRLAEKKKEMRAKIYGIEASYEEVDAEIKELLKDI